jgi:hypothetical protein
MAEPVKPVDAKQPETSRFYYFINDFQGLFLILALVGAYLLGAGYQQSPISLAFIIPGYLCVILGVIAIGVLAYFDIKHRQSVSK